MRNARGFSAIEVLVAISIIAVGLLGAVGLFPSAYRTVDWSGEQTVAAKLAEQQIEWLRTEPYTCLLNTTCLVGAKQTANTQAGNQDQVTATGGGVRETLSGAYAGYTRTTTVAVYPPPPDLPTPGIQQVTVGLVTPSGRSVTLVSVISSW